MYNLQFAVHLKLTKKLLNQLYSNKNIKKKKLKEIWIQDMELLQAFHV